MIVLGTLSGCSKRYDDLPPYLPFSVRDYQNQSVGRFKTSFLADQIDGHYRGTSTGPIGVTTFVNIDDLYTTSTFGRMVGEQLMSELTMKGYDVIELRHSDALQFLSDGGEFALSRDLAVIRRERDLAGLIVGTYVVSPDRVYLNARLVDPSTSMVLSAGSVEMSKTKEIARMLRGGSLPGTLERIPVRHLGFNAYPMYGARNPVYDAEEMGYNNRGGEDFKIQPRFDTSKPKAQPRIVPGVPRNPVDSRAE
jgi:TolB-like protein